MALLPGYNDAIIPIPKIRDYALNPLHPEGKHKAIVFKSALGLTQQDYLWLIDEIYNGIAIIDAVEEENSSFGKRYHVDLFIRTDYNEAVIRTAWIIRNGESYPSLTSCYVI
ncbi:MAG: hypothetical protein SF052_25175 [Bacteroidia bacterium]|nr:hypothetical protein [Bacteroidia bacterium]